MRAWVAIVAVVLSLLAAAPGQAQSSEDKINYLAVPTRITIGGTTFSTTSTFKATGLATKSSETNCLWIAADGSGALGACLAAAANETIAGTWTFSSALDLRSSLSNTGASNGGRVWVSDAFGASGAVQFQATLDLLGALSDSNSDLSLDDNVGITGALGVTGAATFGADAGTADYVSRTTGWRITEPGAGDFRQFFSNVLQVQQFEVDLTSVIAGTQRVTKSASTVSQVFTCPATSATATLWVKDKPSLPNARVFASGDHVSIQTAARADADSDGNLEFSVSDCVGVVTSYADGTSGNDGQQSWTFTRGSATGGAGGSMSTGTVVAVDGVAIDYGTPGMGFAETTAVDGTEGGNSPYLQFARWATSPIAANVTVDCRFGNLSGAYGYASSSGIFGLACGAAAATNVTVDPTNGFRIRSGTTSKFAADTSGNLSLTGDLAMGTAGVIRSGATALDTSTGYWLAHNAGTPQFRIGTMSGSTLTKGIRWDGTNLRLKSDTVTIDENGILVQAASSAPTTLNAYSFGVSGAGGGSNGVFSYYDTGSTTRMTNLDNFVDSGWSAFSRIGIGDGSQSAEVVATNLGGTAFVTLATLGSASGYVRISTNGSVKIHATPSGVHIGSGTAASQALAVAGGVQIEGSAVLAAAMSYGTFSLEYPSFREYIGDGTGYSRKWSKRVSSTTTDLMTLTDAGLLTIVQTTTTGAKYPFVSDAGTIKAKTDGLNATVTCTAGSSVVIAVEYGVVKSVTGTGCS